MARAKFSYPVQSLRGRLADSVFFKGKTGAFVRVFATPDNPQSPDQVATRNFLTAAAQQWGNLTSAQRTAWTAWADAFMKTPNGDGTSSPMQAHQAYSLVAWHAQLCGQPLPSAAPVNGRPVGITSMVQVGAAADALVLTVEHSISPVTNYRALAKVTPGFEQSQSPPSKDLRACRGVGPDSVMALPADGGNVSFTPIRFSIANGERFRAELTVISPEFVPSLPLSAIFTKIVV